MQYPVISTSTDLVFQGTKTYWKTRINLDLVIVYHPKCQGLEVITHHPELGKESRLYLSSLGLLSKLDHNEFQLRLGEKKEVFIKQRKPINVHQLSKEVLYSSITNYIQSRLNYFVSEENEEYSVSLQPLMGDNVINDSEGNAKLDIFIPRPATLETVSPHFQKKISTQDITSAMDSLKASAEELKRATKYAELATSSVDGFKLMLAEKLKLESEMKRMFSPARLRWIKAINRVLVQNYCAKVRLRLEAKESPLHPMAEGLSVNTSFGGQSKKRIRIMRKSIDNSELDKSSSAPVILPEIKHSVSTVVSPTAVSQFGDGVEHRDGLESSLPSLSGKHSVSSKTAQRRRSSRFGHNGTGEAVISGGLPAPRMTRKSLNQDFLMQKYLPDIAMKPSPRSVTLVPISSPTSSNENSSRSANNAVPSLLQSYNTVSQKMTAPLPMTLIQQSDINKDSLSQKLTPILSK